MINIRKLEAELWESADLLRAGSKLTSNEGCRNGVQARLGRQHMDLLGKFQLQLFLLADIQISCFNGIQNLLCDFRIFDRS